MIYRVFFSYNTAQNENRHAQIVMKELAEKQKFKIIDHQPQTVFDGWEFWIETSNSLELPSFIHICPWEPPPN